MQKVYHFIVFLLLLGAGCSGSPVDGAREGGQLFEAGKFSEAEAKYLQLVQAGVENGHVFFNLGNAQIRQGKIGNAIASYREALLFRPRDPDVLANLEYARSKVVEPRVQSGMNPAPGYILLISARAFMSEPFLRYVLLFLCAAICWIVSKPSRRHPVRSIVIGTVFTVCFVCGLGSLLLTRISANGELELASPFSDEVKRVGVVLKPKTDAFAGAAESFPVVFVLPEGAELDFGETRGEWVQVFLEGDRRGWVKHEAIEIISF